MNHPAFDELFCTKCEKPFKRWASPSGTVCKACIDPVCPYCPQPITGPGTTCGSSKCQKQQREENLTFDQLAKKLPSCLAGGVDWMNTTTIDDLAWIAQHEIDLHQEGEDNDIRTGRQLKAVENFLQKCRAAGAES